MKGIHLTPIGDGYVLLEPKDSLNPQDPDIYLQEIVEQLHTYNANALFYDLKKIPLIDAIYYEWLRTLSRLCKLSNVELVVVNTQPTAAYGLAVQLGKDKVNFKAALDVERARKGIWL